MERKRGKELKRKIIEGMLRNMGRKELKGRSTGLREKRKEKGRRGKREKD